MYNKQGNNVGNVTEDGWSSSGGGASMVFPKPSYQVGLTPNDSARDVPDVALAADTAEPRVLVGRRQQGSYCVYDLLYRRHQSRNPDMGGHFETDGRSMAVSASAA